MKNYLDKRTNVSYGYVVENGKVVISKDGVKLVCVDLELGKSVISTVSKAVRTLNKGESDGKRKVGNFSYIIEGSTLTVFDSEDIDFITIENLTDNEIKYARNTAINALLKTLR